MGTGRPSSSIGAKATAGASAGVGAIGGPSEKTSRVGSSPSMQTGFDAGRFMGDAQSVTKASLDDTKTTAADMTREQRSMFKGALDTSNAAGLNYSALGGLDSPAEKTGRVGPAPAASASIPNGPTHRQTEIASMNRLNALDKTLSTIRSVEARQDDPYNGLVSGKPGFNTPTHAPLTGMTIAEVQAYQGGMLKTGHKSTAVGAYQTKASTLDAAVKALGLDPTTTKFSQPVQDQIARQLVEGRTKQSLNPDGTVDPTRLANNLAKEWAGLATSTGKSYYAGKNGNAAGTSYATTKDIASNLASTTPGSIGTGFSAATPSYNDQTSEAPAQKAIADAASPSRQSFRDKYLGGAAPEGSTPAAKAPKELSTPQKFAAGAIDVAASMIPGVGPYAGLVNAGLSLTGNKTIGQQLVGSFANGTGGGTSVGTPDNGGGRNTLEAKTDEKETKKAADDAKAASDATTVKPVERFVSTYLRPTPREKWGRG